jgi:hypothetical protein
MGRLPRLQVWPRFAYEFDALQKEHRRCRFTWERHLLLLSGKSRCASGQGKAERTVNHGSPRQRARRAQRVYSDRPEPCAQALSTAHPGPIEGAVLLAACPARLQVPLLDNSSLKRYLGAVIHQERQPSRP